MDEHRRRAWDALALGPLWRLREPPVGSSEPAAGDAVASSARAQAIAALKPTCSAARRPACSRSSASVEAAWPSVLVACSGVLAARASRYYVSNSMNKKLAQDKLLFIMRSNCCGVGDSFPS